MSSPPRPSYIPVMPPTPRKPRRRTNFPDPEMMFVEQPRLVQRTRIMVEDLTGRVQVYEVDLETDAVYSLKDDIYDRLDLNKNLVKIDLLLNRRILDPYITLKEAGVREGTKLILVLGLRTGIGGTKRATKRKSTTRKTRKSKQ